MQCALVLIVTQIKENVFRRKIHWNEFCYYAFQGRDILLPGIEICKIMACAGSSYIFYKSSGVHKFGRFVFDENDFEIVDSVDTSEKGFNGFLFVH